MSHTWPDYCRKLLCSEAACVVAVVVAVVVVPAVAVVAAGDVVVVVVDIAVGMGEVDLERVLLRSCRLGVEYAQGEHPGSQVAGDHCSVPAVPVEAAGCGYWVDSMAAY